ncbi:MAG TPA: hypothetical protein VG328_10470 [Stellaceae bacterium]|jgi:cytoskeletal protein RodZ|nr:hypothetical protein [Stellaceae bacterium]
MSSSNNRFGRRTGEQSDDLRSEPSLSFNPKRPGARDAQAGADSSVTRTPPSAPRVGRADAAGFGARSGRDAQRDPIPSFMRGREPGPRVDRDDAEEFDVERHDEGFNPRAPREKAMEPRTPAADRPLYHHLFDDADKRGHGFGWAAALGSVVILIVGGAYAWHNFMARPAPGNMFDTPSIASRGPSTGYTTPAQPTDSADNAASAGLNAGSTASTPSPGSAPAPSPSTPPVTTPPTRDVAVAPQPKDIPAEPPPQPKKTISEAAANPGNLGPPVTPPPTATQPAVAPAPVVTPPPKREPPKREAPRREAAITPPKPAPAPVQQDFAPQDVAPPAATQPAAAPALTAAPPRRYRPQASGQPQQLNRNNAPAAYPPPPPQQFQQQPQQPPPNFATRSPPANLAPDNGGQYTRAPNYGAAPNDGSPQPGSPDTVTVDGVTYVSGQEPHSLGTLAGQPQDASSDAPMPPAVPAMPAPSRPPATRYYAPSDHDGGAPLPNDVIILPNGQMAVPDR